MDLTSTVRSDALPAVGSLLIPGGVAAAPYVALAWGPPHDLKAFVDANQGISTAAAALLVVGVGLLIESIGSYFEYYVVDQRHDDREAMMGRWTEYLRIAWKTEPIGQHYLRRVLTVFKFELNMFVAGGSDYSWNSGARLLCRVAATRAGRSADNYGDSGVVLVYGFRREFLAAGHAARPFNRTSSRTGCPEMNGCL